ncbi:hypothetical protein SAMN05216338_1019106 [Bradyrhizobium sp. Rc2d]|nr:hypothetical protein SAMN05216338_1019106 [Bradyrhizobium sp. Rc2d]
MERFRGHAVPRYGEVSRNFSVLDLSKEGSSSGRPSTGSGDGKAPCDRRISCSVQELKNIVVEIYRATHDSQ